MLPTLSKNRRCWLPPTLCECDPHLADVEPQILTIGILAGWESLNTLAESSESEQKWSCEDQGRECCISAVLVLVQHYLRARPRLGVTRHHSFMFSRYITRLPNGY